MRKDLCQSEEKYELFLAYLAKPECGYNLEGAGRSIVLDQSETQKKENRDPKNPSTDLVSQTSSTQVEVGSLTKLISSLEEQQTHRKNTKALNKKVTGSFNIHDKQFYTKEDKEYRDYTSPWQKQEKPKLFMDKT
eukprot:3941363-Rhodomonas_salina.1